MSKNDKNTTSKPESEKTKNVSVTLPESLVEQIQDERWSLQISSVGGVIRHIIEHHFASK